MQLANRIRELRKEKGLSQESLADAIGISKHSINSYESGRREPNSKAMASLEEFFDVSGSYLRGETDDPTPKKWEDHEIMDAVDDELSALPHGLRANAQNCTDQERKLLFDILVELRHITGIEDGTARRAALQLVLQVAHLSAEQSKV